MKIFVKRLDGLTKKLTVNETDELDRVREKVVSVLLEQDISPGRVQLVYRGNVVEHGRLCDVGIQEEGVIIVAVKDREFIDITVEFNGESFILKVESCETVDNVKAMISQRKGYSVDGLHLVFGGRDIVEGRLHHSGISHGSVLQLTLRTFEIFVKDFQGNSHVFLVRTSDKVDRLMSMVHDRLAVNKSQQVLTHKGQQLQSGRQLKEYDIRQHSTIHLTGRLRGGRSFT